MSKDLYPKYSIEKYKDGTMIVFLHCALGVISLFQLSDQAELEDFIKMLEGCVVEIPEVFKRVMGED